MRAITVRAPWSWVIAETAALTALGIPAKVENRDQRLGKQAAKRIGEPLLIHAGKSWSDAGERDPHVRQAWWTFGQAIQVDGPNPLLAAVGDLRTGWPGWLRPNSLWIPTCAVVAMAVLADAHEAEQRPDGSTCCQPWGERTYLTKAGFGPAWHLVFDGVRRLPEPVPAAGALGLWTPSPELVSAVQAQLAAAVNR